MKRIGQARIEWALLGVIGAVCAVLSFLQYRWTGELSRAEPALLRAGLNEQVPRLARAFDEEIRDNCTLLLPDAKEIRELGAMEAHTVRYRRWAGSHDRSLFARIGFGLPERETIDLYGIDGEGRIAPLQWPPNWENLRARCWLASRAKARRPTRLPIRPQYNSRFSPTHKTAVRNSSG